MTEDRPHRGGEWAVLRTKAGSDVADGRTIAIAAPSGSPPVTPAASRATWAASCLLVLLMALSSGCSPTPGAEPATESRPSPSQVTAPAAAPLVPDHDAYFGVYYGNGSITRTDREIGRTPQVHLTYFSWRDDWATDPVLAADQERGQISLVNWEPFGADFSAIVAGTYDAMLTARAREAAQLPRAVFLDFAAEMNEEEGWGGHDPALYVAAWRHIHDIFAEHGADKLVWVWAPNNTDSEDAPPALDYYPGDDYVDWTGIDGYNWGTSQVGFRWQSFPQVFGDVYADLHQIGKPIIIAETASSEQGGSKPGWIDQVAPALATDFPDIKAVVWFDVKKERDWRIDSTPATLDAVRRLAANPVFSASVP